ncbi:MAG: hypothetical protein HY895_19385 [Deltaproteobacteria bacterium]|nr:hypothetical protein [Deltaproteobacteria bacterium]
MTDTLPDKESRERLRALQHERREILALPPEEALNRILSAREPAALVHSIPGSDLYLLVHDIGPEDALPLLALASDAQWDHIVDLEGWAKDRIEVHSVTRWLSLLLESDPQRFLRWLLKDRLEFAECYLFHNIEVRVLEQDQDPSEFGDDFFTLDGTYFIRFLKLLPVPGGSAIGEEERKEFLMKLLQRLAAHDHLVFLNVLLEATHVIPAETEEEEHHWRTVRLAEKGFLPFGEAIGIYQPVQPKDLENRASKHIPRRRAESSPLPVPSYPLREMEADNHFSRALDRVEPQDILTQVQWEFANLCNQIIVADQRAIRDRAQLHDIVKKACGYISMGLERLRAAGEKEVDPRKAAAALIRHPLVQVFRLGFGAVLELKWEAEKWLSRSWFVKSGLRLTFWGEQWTGVLGGLLLKKPLYYDNYKTGVLYREFVALEEVALTEGILRQVQAVDRLLAVMNIQLGRASQYGFLTYKNLILSRWAGHCLGLREEKLAAIPVSGFKDFFAELLPGESSSESTVPRRIPEAMKSGFIEWLARDTGLKDFEITESLGRIFEDLFGEIEAEYGRVTAKDLDPRFVQLFLLKT